MNFTWTRMNVFFWQLVEFAVDILINRCEEKCSFLRYAILRCDFHELNHNYCQYINLND